MTTPAITSGQERNACRAAPLLDLDTDLGEFVPAERLEQSRHELLVRVYRIAAGAWDTTSLSVSDPGHMGLLLLDGVVSREVLAADIVSTELLGPGELLRPWEIAPDASLLKTTVRWSVLSEARVAVLDRRLTGHLATYPEVMSQLVERLTQRAQRLAVTQAISQLNRVDRRLLTLFWHLAERWGRMTPDGVLIPLTLSHRMLSQLVGARRPTVSTALGELARSGDVQRLDNGTWLLTGDPVGAPEGAGVRMIPPRRRFVPAELHPAHAAHGPVVRTGETSARGAELRIRLARLREECSETRAQLSGALEATSIVTLRTAELRDARASARALRAGS